MSPRPPAPPVPQADLRPPSQVMRLAQMGAMHPTRLSFIPSLLRELQNGGWTFARTLWEMDARGVGVGVYRASRPDGGVFSLVAFGHDLPPEKTLRPRHRRSVGRHIRAVRGGALRRRRRAPAKKRAAAGGRTMRPARIGFVPRKQKRPRL